MRAVSSGEIIASPHGGRTRRQRGPRWVRARGGAEEGTGASAGRAGGKGRRCMRQEPRGVGLGVRLDGGPGRLGGHRRLRGAWRSRLMRHFLLLPPRRLRGRMGGAPVPDALVAPTRLAHRLGPSAPAAPTPAVAPAPVARRAEEEDLPALGSAAHPEAQRLHATPARVGFWRRAPECATSCPPVRPIRTPGAPSQEGLPAVTGGPFRLLGRTQLPTPPVGRPTHNFLAMGPGGDALRGPRASWHRMGVVLAHPWSAREHVQLPGELLLRAERATDEKSPCSLPAPRAGRGGLARHDAHGDLPERLDARALAITANTESLHW